VIDAIAYADRIANCPEVASFHARLAAQRFLRDLDAARRHKLGWVFDENRALRAMLFSPQMPNIKGPESNKPIRLMDWQKFVFANVFGWVERETRIRRFRQAAVFVPKGNGKTTISAPLSMDLTFGEGEGGAEGYAAAVTRDQAKTCFASHRRWFAALRRCTPSGAWAS
jgi:phage terminase large subunit-like protein